MSSGQHHSGVTKGISSGLLLGSFLSNWISPVELLSVAIGCLFGIVMSGDLDSDGGFIGDFYIRKTTGKAGFFIWNIVWSPYRRGLKHRSFWSHTPIIGTVVRLVFLVLPIIIIPIKDQSSTSIFEIIPKAFIAQIVTLPFTALLTIGVYLLWAYTQVDLAILGLALFTGLSISDVGHWALDL